MSCLDARIALRIHALYRARALEIIPALKYS